ncbi:hypothetical protein ACLUUA_18735 [Enterobacterales bacterium AN_CKDN230030167-1A_HGKHYDSX7]
MHIFTTILSALGTIVILFGVLIAWAALKPEQRTDLNRLLRQIWQHSTKIIPILMAALVTTANCWEIYQFGILQTAPTRGNILVLLMNIWNAASYFFFGLVLFVLWLKNIVNKDFPIQSQT